MNLDSVSYFVAIPEKPLVDLIFEFRNELVGRGIANYDPRGSITPHITLAYFSQPKEQIAEIVDFEAISPNFRNYPFECKDYVAFDNKMSLNLESVFWTMTANELYNIYDEKIFQSDSRRFAANHIKLAREIKDLEAARELWKSYAVSQVKINEVALVDKQLVL